MTRTGLFATLLLVLAAALPACSSDGGGSDAPADVTADVPADTGLDVVAPDPGTPDPGTPDPGTPDPGTPDPGTADPGTPPDPEADLPPTDPGTSDPGTADPGTTDPGTTDPGTETSQLPDNFSCVGNIEWPNPGVATYTHTYGLLELMTQEPVVGATAKVCGMDDPECAAPLSSGVSDQYGNVTVTFPAAAEGLDGYVEFSGPDIVTTLGFYRETDNTVAYTTPGAFPTIVLGTTTLVALAALANVELDPTRGSIIYSAADCANVRAAGISADVESGDAGTIAVYVEGGMPSAELTATTAEGQGGLLNVPVGATKVHAYWAETGDEIGVQDVIVRAGAVSATLLVPTPLW